MLNDALSDCRNAIRRDGNKPAYPRSLSLVQRRVGHYANSIKAYQQAVTLMPKSAWAWYGLGLAELHSGQVAKGNAGVAGARVLVPTIDARAAKFALTASGK